MPESFSLGQAFQQWETLLETIATRLEHVEQELAHLDQLEQRIAALEQPLPSPKASLASPGPVPQASPSPWKHPSVDERRRFGLPPPVRTLVARWLGEHGVNEQTARNWDDLPLDDLAAALLYAKQRIEAAGKTRSLRRVLYRCENPHCPCQEMSLPGSLPSTADPTEDPDAGLPPPIRRHIARWLAQHGANFNTVSSVGWRLMPLDPREALRFAQARIAAPAAGGARARGVRIRTCQNPKCVCHEVLAEQPSSP